MSLAKTAAQKTAMNSRIRHTEQLPEELSHHDYVLGGSAVLAGHGLRENKDLDVLVTKKAWKKLIQKYPTEPFQGRERINLGDVEIFPDWPGLNSKGVFKRRQMHTGHPTMHPKDWRKFKRHLGRPKDVEDLKAFGKKFPKHSALLNDRPEEIEAASPGASLGLLSRPGVGENIPDHVVEERARQSKGLRRFRRVNDRGTARVIPGSPFDSDYKARDFSTTGYFGPHGSN